MNIESENKDELTQNNINQRRRQQQPQSELFSCFNCGRRYKAYPPDSSFIFPYISPCSETHNLDDNHNHRQPYECVNFTIEIIFIGVKGIPLIISNFSIE